MKIRCYKKVNRFFVLLIVSAMIISVLSSGMTYAYDKNDEVHLPAIAHIDTAWQWPFEDTVNNIIPDTFNRQIAALKANPNLKFTVSATSHLEWIKEYYPKMWEDIKKLEQNGQIDIVGGQVVEEDTNSPSGESLLRQGLNGQKFLQENFGKKSTVGFLPDCFGFSGNYPQILQQTGMTSFSTSKLSWNDTNKFPYNLFNWKGIDGSQVLAYETVSNYDHQYSDSEILQMLDNLQKIGVRKAYGSFGRGDHGGGPDLRAEDAGKTESQENGNSYQKVLNQDARMAPHVINSTPTQYFDSVKQDDLSKVPTWEGEMYLEYHRGTYTSWARQKAENRMSEIAAEQAEKAGTIGKWLGVIPDNSDIINKAWDKILINQMHDIQPGSSVPMQYEVSFNMNEMARNQLNTVKNYGLQAMAYKADTNMEKGVPVFVFNPLSWTRNDQVETTLQFNEEPKNVRIYDKDGKEMPSKVLSAIGNKAVVRFEAQDVPSLGYKIFRAEISDTPFTGDTGLSISGNAMENQYYKIEINPETGNISHIYNKKDSNRDILNGEGNELQIFKDTGGSSFPAWDIMRSEVSPAGGDPYDPTYKLNDKPNSIEVIENSKEKAVIRISRTWGDSSFSQDIIMYPNIERIDVKMNVNWHEKDKLLKVSFPFSAVSNKATYEIAYGSLERSTNRDTSFDGARFEQSGHKWADITNEADNAFGASILNDSKYGWDVYKYKDNSKTRLRLSLLRSARTASSSGYGYKDPGEYPAMDQGVHNFTYSIYPHAGDWTSAQTVRRGYELNYPVTAFQAQPHGGTLGKEVSFVKIDKPNVIASVVKSPYGEPESKDLIVRMYESSGKEAVAANITFPTEVKSAKQVNALEENYAGAKPVAVSGNSVSADFGKYEIKTLRVSLSDPEGAAVTQSTAAADLYSFFNLDGVSGDAKRSDGNLDGQGNTYSAELWPEKVNFQGVPFMLGPLKDGYKNLVEAKGQTIPLPAGNYKYVYLLGASAGTDKSEGLFTVNYNSGNKAEKNIKFAQWNAMITGWDRNAGTDVRPVVRDGIAYNFTHYHKPGGDAVVKDNFLYIYKIPVDTNETIKEITLPDAPGIKLAAISTANSDFLEKAELPDPNELNADIEPPTQVTGVTAELKPADMQDQIVVTWNASTDNDQIAYYKVYRGVTEDFIPADENYMGLVSQGAALKYTDTLAARNTYYYIIIAYDRAGNESSPSSASNPILGGLDNAFLSRDVTEKHSGEYAPDEIAKYALDGSTNTKWCGPGVNSWLEVDLGAGYTNWTISKFVLMHAQAGGEGANYNTKKFKIQTRNNTSEDWTDRAVVDNNTNGITVHGMPEPIQARYYRLFVEVPENQGNNAVRIYEFQALGEYSGPPMVPTAKDLYVNVQREKNNSLKFTGEYTFVPVDNFRKELNSQYRWYGETGDKNYELISGQSGLTLSLPENTTYKSVKFEVIPRDTKEGGTAISKEINIDPNKEEDQLLKKRVTATHELLPNEAASKAVDGDNTTKWCSNKGVDVQQSMTVDMGGVYSISSFELRHSQSIHDYKPGDVDDQAGYNTADYSIAMSKDGIAWDAPVIEVTGNTEAITTDTVTTTGGAIGRYVKLTITKANSANNIALRIYDFKALGKPNFIYVPSADNSEEPSDVMASDVAISGTPEVNKPLKGSYTVVEPEHEQFCKFRWLQSDSLNGVYTAIFNANDKVFTPTKDLEDKYLKFEVRVGQGIAVTSSPVKVEAQTAVNVLLNSNVSANKETAGNEGNKAVDGDDSTYWFAEGNDNTLTCTLDSMYLISSFTVKHAGSAASNTKDFEIYISENGETWTKAEEVKNNTSSTSMITLEEPIRAEYIRLHVTASYNSAPFTGTTIKEFEAYGIQVDVSAPNATNVTIPSQAETGKLMVASYRYDDPKGNWEENSILQWVQSDTSTGTFTAISGADSKYYRPTSDVTGKYIKFTVVPVNRYGVQGATAESQAVLVENAKPTVADIVITGEKNVKGKLTMNYRYVDMENDPEGGTVIQWYRSEPGSSWTEIAGVVTNELDLAGIADINPGRTSVKCSITPKQADGVTGGKWDSGIITINPMGSNVLKGASATASSSANSSSENPDKLVDGDYGTKWCVLSSDNNKWWVGDMGSSSLISTFVLRNCKTSEPGYSNTKAFTILTSMDGQSWKEVKAYKGIADTLAESITVYQLPEPENARYVKLTVDETPTARLYELEAWGEKLGTTLEIPDHSTTLDSGEEFSIRYGINVTPVVTGQAIELAYDSSLFDFMGAESCDNGTVIESVETGMGKVDVSLSHVFGISGNKAVLNLKFRARIVTSDDSGKGNISVSKAVLTSISGETFEVLDKAIINLSVNSVKSALYQAVDSANTKYQGAIVGVGEGNYFRGAKEKLNQAIAAAEAALNSGTGDYVKAKEDLLKVLAEFENSVITDSTGDLNGDGIHDEKDLVDIMQYYGMKTDTLEGNEKLADIDGDGEVGLTDLVFAALKIERPL